WDGNARDAVALAREAHAYAVSDGTAKVVATNYLAQMLLFSGEVEDGERLLATACDLWMARNVEETLMTPGPILGMFCTEDYAAVQAIFDDATASARHYGATAALPFYLGAKAEIDFSTGNWANAYAAALQGVDLGTASGQPTLTGYSLAG